VIVTKMAARKQLAFFPHNFILTLSIPLSRLGRGGAT
jgi:hypothetical protein